MSKIIPTVISKSYKDLQKKIKLAEKFKQCRLIQLDIMDGKFVKTNTINFKTIDKLKTKLKFELHLMIQNPEKYIEQYIKTKPACVIIHFESTKDIKGILKTLKKHKTKSAIALNPKTKIEKLKPFISYIDFVLLLAVDPGYYGASFKSSTYLKIKSIKRKYPKLKVEIDGGVSLENIGNLKKAGADNFCVGSRIFKTNDPKSSYLKFTKAIK